jgi:site-specific DNA recombinase
MDVTELYDDCARSGGSIMGRDGLLRLMDRARDRVIIVEALDRLSRDMEDLAGIHKRLSFLGLEIGGVHEALVPCWSGCPGRKTGTTTLSSASVATSQMAR